MFWTKDEKKLKPVKGRIVIIKKQKKKSTLNVKKATEVDSGLYACHAMDSFGRHISMYAWLKVEGRLSWPLVFADDFIEHILL